MSPQERETALAAGRGRDFTTVQRFRLVVSAGPDSGLTHVSNGARVVIGAHESVDLVLRDPTTSRFHCEVLIENGRALVRDLGSRNGTRVGGIEVREAFLESGSRLNLGNSEIRFELVAEQVRVPLSQQERFGRLIARSDAMRAVFAVLERAAATDTTVLLEGETGTGKGAAAESMHELSARADGPFVVVDCGGLPRTLLESELFGHERGAFTGAIAERCGAFEAAHGGTVFLDEIGELPLELQPLLLRVLEERMVKRIGTHEYTRVDVRVLAATNRDLRTEVNAGRFRADLYYRLAVLTIRIPPLRERPEDIPIIAEAMLSSSLAPASAEVAAAVRDLDSLARLADHRWPGNVRELRNHLERCVALQDPDALITPSADPTDTAPATTRADRPLKEARELWVREFERRYLTDLLERNDGNVTAASRDAGVARVHLYRLLWRHGLR